ncbi:MAG: ATP-binding cassette domain-containing protein, partial [Exilibacterium sp.]
MTRDLGLLHIDPDIARSKQPLPPQQWRLLQGHVAVSHHFLAIVPTLPKAVSRAVLEHHERCDGLGYPYGKLGDELCLEGQVVALADMIVALITKQVDILGYSMRAIIPVLQLNLSVHFNRVTEAAICALRALVTDCDRVYDNCEIPAVIETIIARQQPLASWFEQICALIRDASVHADSKHIRITNAYLARIQATLISSGMITREQRCWLEDVLPTLDIQPDVIVVDPPEKGLSTTAVDHISFHVAAGEVLGFLGPNGAGKSTTIKMLTGQLRPQEGKATLLGEDITRRAKEIQAHIGVCFELTNLYEQMSAVENLALFARLFGIKGFKADPLLARVGLDGRGKDRVETSSKGMKQRLMVARSLINQPQILFLDE